MEVPTRDDLSQGLLLRMQTAGASPQGPSELQGDSPERRGHPGSAPPPGRAVGWRSAGGLANGAESLKLWTLRAPRHAQGAGENGLPSLGMLGGGGALQAAPQAALQ